MTLLTSIHYPPSNSKNSKFKGVTKTRKNSFKNPQYLARDLLGLWYCKIDSLNQNLLNTLKIVMKANAPESYRLIFASHSSTGLPSGFSKYNIVLHVGESVCDKYQNFSVNLVSASMVHRENRRLRIYRQVETVVLLHGAKFSFVQKPISRESASKDKRNYSKSPLIRKPVLEISLFCFLNKGAIS